MAHPLRASRTPARGRRWRPGVAGTAAAARCVAAVLALLAVQAQGADLVDAWRAAQAHDPEFAAAQAARDAGQARREQGASLWRPTLQFSGAAGIGTNETSTTGARFSAPGFGTVEGASFDTSVTQGNLWRWSLQARQPLINRERDASKRQLELSADAADLEWRATQQALMLRVAERYFDAALAAEALRVQRRQQEAIERALVEVRDRFKLGDVPVTDTHEAKARAEGVRAEVLAAEAALQLKRSALADTTGWSDAQMQSLPLPDGATPQDVAGLQQWLADVRSSNLQLRLLAATTEVAREEAAKHSAMSSPSLDLVAMAGQDRLSGSGAYGQASNSLNNSMIGVQLNVPLYTGGYRSAREQETLRLADKAAADGDRHAQQVAQATRAAWLGLTVGASRLAALDEALRATRARLEATRLGRKVGDRTTLELLNAENDAAAAELAVQQARIALLLDRLRLVALTGSLDETQLQLANAGLQALR
jgi:outer membrane protein